MLDSPARKTILCSDEEIAEYALEVVDAFISIIGPRRLFTIAHTARFSWAPHTLARKPDRCDPPEQSERVHLPPYARSSNKNDAAGMLRHD